MGHLHGFRQSLQFSRPSIESQIPLAVRKGLGVIAMKTFGGRPGPLVGEGPGRLSAEALLQYAWSQPVALAIPGVASRARFRANLAAARSFRPAPPEELRRMEAQIDAAPVRGSGRNAERLRPQRRGRSGRHHHPYEGTEQETSRRRAWAYCNKGLPWPRASEVLPQPVISRVTFGADRHALLPMSGCAPAGSGRVPLTEKRACSPHGEAGVPSSRGAGVPSSRGAFGFPSRGRAHSPRDNRSRR